MQPTISKMYYASIYDCDILFNKVTEKYFVYFIFLYVLLQL